MLKTSVSLRQLFPKAQIVGADDICCCQCSAQADVPAKEWVFAAGLAGDCDLARETVDAINLGAIGILTEQLLPSSVPQCIVPDVREAYAQVCHAIANNPSTKILTIGILGTHGKTSAALFVASMLKRIGNHVAYYTSLGASDGKQKGLPTSADAEAIQLVEWMADSVDCKTPVAILEISDEMLCSHATDGIEFDVVLFTGLRKSQRLDVLRSRGVENAYHRIIGQLKNHGVVVYNADDARLNRWMERHQPHAISYGLDAVADVRGKRIGSLKGEQSMMMSAGKCVMPITSRILGDHNARHMLGAAAIGFAFGLELFEIVQGIETLARIPGRMQRVPGSDEVPVYIDNSDQADRLAVALHALSKYGDPIVCVAEVPESATPEQLSAYGRVLERSATTVILTQSRWTPQFGQRRTWQLLDGCENPSKIHIVPNREAAIELALRNARPGDQILLAGWGTDSWTNSQSKRAQSDFVCVQSMLTQIADEPRTVSTLASLQPRIRGGAA